jgi:hypothetical protein
MQDQAVTIAASPSGSGCTTVETITLVSYEAYTSWTDPSNGVQDTPRRLHTSFWHRPVRSCQHLCWVPTNIPSQIVRKSNFQRHFLDSVDEF